LYDTALAFSDRDIVNVVNFVPDLAVHLLVSTEKMNEQIISLIIMLMLIMLAIMLIAKLTTVVRMLAKCYNVNVGRCSIGTGTLPSQSLGPFSEFILQPLIISFQKLIFWLG